MILAMHNQCAKTSEHTQLMKIKALTTSFPFKFTLAALAVSVSLTAMQAAIVVSSTTGVFRYSTSGVLEHTYQPAAGWQGVAADNSTGNIYMTATNVNGALFQFAYDGTTPTKEIMSFNYAGGLSKTTIGVTFNNGLVIANPFFNSLGAAEVSGFNPADPTDTTPGAGRSFYPSNATGITPSSVAGRYYFTDFNGIVFQLNNFGVGGTPAGTQIATGLSGGIRGLALSADETSLFVADVGLNKVIKITIATGVATDFITTGVNGATDVLRIGSDLYVSTSTGVDQYAMDGTLVQNDLIALSDARYMTNAVPEPSTYALIMVAGLAVYVIRRRQQLAQ